MSVHELSYDLIEMTSGAEPQTVKQVVRDHLQEILIKQIIGNSATLSIVAAVEDVEELPEAIKFAVERDMRDNPQKFEERRARAAQRYHFFERNASFSASHLESTTDEIPF